ncbi:MAG: Uma2 family endonuclease [Planctomycetaceae bacterium]
MSSALRFEHVSPEEFLRGEEFADGKHEYVDGRIYAMAGATDAHNRIASRVLGSLFGQLTGSSCEALNSDAKVRVSHKSRTYFYYPDAMIVCHSNPDSDHFQDQPVVIVEVVSESTRRTDEGEKRLSYLTIPSLQHYLLFEQDRPAVRVFSRNSDGEFEERSLSGVEIVIHLTPLTAQLRLADIYA